MNSCEKSVYAYAPINECWSVSAFIPAKSDYKLNTLAFNKIYAFPSLIPICFTHPVYYFPNQITDFVNDLNNSNFNAVLSGNYIVINDTEFDFSSTIYSQYLSAFSPTPSSTQIQEIKKYVSPTGEFLYINQTTADVYTKVQSNWTSAVCQVTDIASLYAAVNNISSYLDPNFLTLAGSVDLDWTLNTYSTTNVATITLTGNKYLNIKNLVPGSQGTLIINQDVSGNRTLTFPISSKFINGGPYTFVKNPSGIDIYNFTFDGTNLLWTHPANNPITKFVPTDIEGIVAWYSPETIPNIANTGSVVSVWNDKSGYGNHLYAQAGGGGNHTAALVTNNLNGYNNVRFNANAYPNASYFQSRNILPLSAFTVFGVTKRNLNSNLGMIWHHWDVAGTGVALLSFYNGSFVYKGASGILQDKKYFRSFWPNGTSWMTWSQSWSGSYMHHELMVNGKNAYEGKASTGYTPGVSAVVANIGMGDSSDYGSQAAMDMAEFIIYNRYLTDAEKDKVTWYLNDKFNLPEKDYLRDNVFVLCDGNSLTEGQGIWEYNGTQPAGNRYWELPVAGLSARNYHAWSVGVGGQTTTDMISDFEVHSRKYFSPYRKGNLVVAWEITNDISVGSTDTQAYNNYVNYCNLCRKNGWKVVACTVIPRSGFNATQETYRNSVNIMIRNNYTSFADGLADFAAHPNFDSPADSWGPWPNASNYYDGTHLINYSAIAQVASAAILSVPF